MDAYEREHYDPMYELIMKKQQHGEMCRVMLKIPSVGKELFALLTRQGQWDDFCELYPYYAEAFRFVRDTKLSHREMLPEMYKFLKGMSPDIYGCPRQIFQINLYEAERELENHD